MKRTHNTNSTEIDLTKMYSEIHEISLKPNGLWYGINDEWLQWCKIEQLDWIKPHLFHIDLNIKEILVIQTKEELIDFHKEYLFKNYREVFGYIDWGKVKEKYKGIEFRNYYEIKYGFWEHPIWYYGLDCSCGCIWDLSCIKKITKHEFDKVS